MNNTNWRSRLPISIIIAAAFIVGAYRVSVEENGLDGFVLITIAVVLVGVWIAAELHDKFFSEYNITLRTILREELNRPKEEPDPPKEE